MILKITKALILAALISGCKDEKSNIPSVEERISAATNSLRNELVAPVNGWKLEYQPTPDAGIFLMLLDFEENGNLTIHSDLADNNGEFYEQTISYRIDNSLSTELIFETYGVFHYLFELDQASFGAEFEFIYEGKEGNNLIFTSKSDYIDPTVLVFEPAGSNDEALFTRDIAENLIKFTNDGPQALIAVTPGQQLVLEDKNISIFWTLDNSKRNIVIDMIGAGTNVEDIIASSSWYPRDHFTGFSLSNGSLKLVEPFSTFFNGQNITVSSINLNNFDASGGPSFCSTGTDTTPTYSGTAAGLGKVTLRSTLLSGSGSGFIHSVYSINVFYIFDESGNSLSEDGIINEKFPNASGFVFLYGVALVNPDIPIYSLGIITDDGELYLREFDPTDTEGNFINLNFNGNFYYTITPPEGTEQDLIDVTDEIFAGGVVYAFDFPQSGVYRLYNPCNRYEVFLAN